MQIKKYTITIHAKQMSYTHIELFTCLQKSNTINKYIYLQLHRVGFTYI